MNKDEYVMKIGKDRALTAAEVNDFLGFSDSNSDGSDWETIKDDAADNFLKKKEEVKPVKRKFEINNQTKMVMPGDIIHKNDLPAPEKQPVKNSSKYFIAEPTKIRVYNPQVTSDNWKDRISGRQVLTPHKLCQGNMKDSLSDTDWILVGVIVQAACKKDKNNNNFSIWHLNDLQCLDKAVKVMLFRQVYEQFWKEATGTVVAILQPKSLPTNENFKSSAFTVDTALQILVLGRSPDFGICQGKSKSGESCTNVVNKSDCSMCSYHVQSGYFKAISRPGFVNLGFERLNERKRSAAGMAMPPLEWNREKQPKMEGKYAGNSRSGISLEKLQQSGITARATEWGLLDKTSSGNMAGNMAAPVKMSAKDVSMVKLLRKPTAGTKNLVKHIVEKSIGPEAIGSNIVKQNRIFDDTPATAAKGFTFESFKQKRMESIAAQNAPVASTGQSIDLGYKPVKLDQVSAEVYRAELNKLRIAAQAKEMGGYAAMKESNRQEHLRKIAVPNRRTADSLDNKAKKPALSEEMLKLLSQGSSNRKLVEVEKMADFDEKLDKMEVIEKFETKLTTQHEQECVVFICVQCQTKTGRQPKGCVTEGHTVKSIKGFRRYFKCIKCHTRTTTYDKYPDGSCLKCGACAYERTGRMKERQVASETLKVHGNEKRFINN